MNKFFATSLLVLACLLTVNPAQAQDAVNLVTNPGFEDSFTGYTITPAADGSDLEILGASPHSGMVNAGFGGTNSMYVDTISQSLQTTPGATYQISFWLANGDTQGQNAFHVTFGGQTLLDLTNAAATDGYTQYTFDSVPGTDGSTIISFSGNCPSAYYYLDDISVTVASIPEPATWFGALGCVGLLAGAARSGRLSRRA